MTQKKKSLKTCAPRKLEVYEKEFTEGYEYFAGYSTTEPETRISVCYVHKGWERHGRSTDEERKRAIQTIAKSISEFIPEPIIRRVTLNTLCAHCPLTSCKCSCATCHNYTGLRDL